MSKSKIILILRRTIPSTSIYREEVRVELDSLEALVPTLSRWDLRPRDRIYVQDPTGLCSICRVKKIINHMLNVEDVEVLEWTN